MDGAAASTRGAARDPQVAAFCVHGDCCHVVKARRVGTDEVNGAIGTAADHE